MEEPLLTLNADVGLYATESSYLGIDDRLFNYEIPSNQNMRGGVLVLLNTAIGSGTLMIPYCFRAGIGNYIIMSVSMALLALSSLWMMIDAAYSTKTYDYKGLFGHIFGKHRNWIVYVVIFLVQLGVCSIYCQWNGRLINRALGISSGIASESKFWIVISSLVFVVPLTLLKTIHKLEGVAVISTIFMGALIVHSAYWAIKGWIQDGFDPHNELKWFAANDVIITSLSVNAMAYNCIINLFSCLMHLKNCTVRRARHLTNYTISLAFICYSLFGAFTYLHLFDQLQGGSALEYYSTDSLFTRIILFGVVMILVSSAPLVLWGARNSIISLFWKEEQPSYGAFASIGVGLALAATCIACMSENIIIYFDIVGGVFTPILIFLLPALFYLRGVPNRPWYRTATAYFGASFCIVAMVACVRRAVLHLISKD